MARATSKKTIRTGQPIKALRRVSTDDGETDEREIPGASGNPHVLHRRPGRFAAYSGMAPRGPAAARRQTPKATHAEPRREPPKAKAKRKTARKRSA